MNAWLVFTSMYACVCVCACVYAHITSNTHAPLDTFVYKSAQHTFTRTHVQRYSYKLAHGMLAYIKQGSPTAREKNVVTCTLSHKKEHTHCVHHYSTPPLPAHTRTHTAYTIQGNTAAEKRHVDLYLLYDEEDCLQNMVIGDNGKGMDDTGLQQYATFSYSQESRKDDGVIDLVRVCVRRKNKYVHILMRIRTLFMFFWRNEQVSGCMHVHTKIYVQVYYI
jgi:hypothetical protein